MSLDHLSGDAREKLDDACLSALMEEYLGIEGANLEGETLRLNSDAEFRYPDALDEKCLKEIEAHFANERRRRRLQTLRKLGNAAAILAVVLLLGWAVLYSAVENVQLSTAVLFKTGPWLLIPAVIAAAAVAVTVVTLIRHKKEAGRTDK